MFTSGFQSPKKFSKDVQNPLNASNRAGSKSITSLLFFLDDTYIPGLQIPNICQTFSLSSVNPFVALLRRSKDHMNDVLIFLPGHAIAIFMFFGGEVIFGFRLLPQRGAARASSRKLIFVYSSFADEIFFSFSIFVCSIAVSLSTVVKKCRLRQRVPKTYAGGQQEEAYLDGPWKPSGVLVLYFTRIYSKGQALEVHYYQ
jgi:hypothetical protein